MKTYAVVRFLRNIYEYNDKRQATRKIIAINEYYRLYGSPITLYGFIYLKHNGAQYSISKKRIEEGFFEIIFTPKYRFEQLIKKHKVYEKNSHIEYNKKSGDNNVEKNTNNINH